MNRTQSLKQRFLKGVAVTQNVADLTGRTLLSVIRFGFIRFADNWFHLGRWLEKKGWYPLDSGFFSTVYGTPCGRFVLKIARGGVPHRDDNYDGYARYAMANPGNPYLPNIYLHFRTDFGTITLMERLTPLTQELTAFYERIRLSLKSPSLQEVGADHNLQSLLARLHSMQNRLDLKPCNFMVRGEQLVITDPLLA